jgi:predicted CoA-binding protein
MAHQNPDGDALFAILSWAQTIAVVGASSSPDRPSHGIFQRLLRHGYTVIPVNPKETEVLGQRAYASLDEVPVPIDIVDVFRRAIDTPSVAEAAVRVGAKVLWLQSGISNDETARIARDGGLEVVMDACIAVELSLLHVPAKR